VPGRYDAQWNDDFHHSAHVVLTGERDGYYRDFAERPVALLARSLAEGFAFQGEVSPFHGRTRGEPSAALPPSAFIDFLQNHDQVGNRAGGERLLTMATAQRLRALVALQLLAPSPPLIFMGEEAGARTPFLYFCDFPGELARAVRAGREREFPGFADAQRSQGKALPDPGAAGTFAASKLDWAARNASAGREWLAYYRLLLGLRRSCVLPLLPRLSPARFSLLPGSERSFEVTWPTTDGGALVLRANLDDEVSPPFATPLLAPFVAIGAPADDPDSLGPWAMRGYLLPVGETAR
jgi:1,4-alpha-glucan branching enzyme/maltooligosyltrehalose trehalohydrolase